MLVKDKNIALLFLILFSLLSGILWRAELESHGWDGLNWLTYFHLAIPLSLGMFVLWVNVFFTLTPISKRLFANLLLLFWIFLGTCSIWLSLIFLFQGGPFAFIYHLPPWLYLGFLLCVISFFLPLGALFSLRLIRVKVPKRLLLLSLLLFWSAIPIATFLIDVIPEREAADVVHSFKTGLVFPFLFFSLGFPLIYCVCYTKQPKEGDPAVLDA